MKKFYMATQHNITRQLADVRYPITKEALLNQVGERIVQNGFDSRIALKDILSKCPHDHYSCAGELYNNIACVLW